MSEVSEEDVLKMVEDVEKSRKGMDMPYEKMVEDVKEELINMRVNALSLLAEGSKKFGWKAEWGEFVANLVRMHFDPEMTRDRESFNHCKDLAWAAIGWAYGNEHQELADFMVKCFNQFKPSELCEKFYEEYRMKNIPDMFKGLI